MAQAARFGVRDRDTVTVALAGFLARGGLLLLALPSMILPSTLQIAGFLGVQAIGIDGRPTAWLFEMFGFALAVFTIWLVVSAIFGALVDVWLVGSALWPREESNREARPLPKLGLLLDMAAVRTVCLLPVGLSFVFAGFRIYQSAYNELVTPSSLGTPLVLRVVLGSLDAVILVVFVWLLAETVSAIAVRQILMGGHGAIGSLREAVFQIVRRPVSTLMTVLASTAVSVAFVGLAMAATYFAFGLCLDAARLQDPVGVTIGSVTKDFRPVVFLAGTVVLGVAWVVALALAGVASAWRSAAMTAETAIDLVSNPRR